MVLKIMISVAVLVGALNLSAPCLAGDAWNILDPAVSEVSRETSAALFDGASSLFAGLAESERQNRRSPERFLEAAERLETSSKLFVGLAESEFATGRFPFGDIESGERLYEWLRSVRGGDIRPFEEVTAADLLLAASVEAANISLSLRESLSDDTYPNPSGVRNAIDRYGQFLSVGTIAADGFALMSSG